MEEEFNFILKGKILEGYYTHLLILALMVPVNNDVLEHTIDLALKSRGFLFNREKIPIIMFKARTNNTSKMRSQTNWTDYWKDTMGGEKGRKSRGIHRHLPA